MSLNLLKPQHGLPQKPSEIRDNLQHVLGAALPDCILPDDDNTFGFKITAQGGLVARVGAGRGIIGKKYHDDRDYHDIALPARRACLLYKLKNTATDSVTPSDGYIEAKLPDVSAQTLRYVLDGSATIANTGTGGTNIATKTGTVTPTDGRVGYSGLGSTAGYYTCASNTGVPAYTSVSTRILVIDNFVSNGAIQIFHNDGISKFGCTAADILTINGVSTGYTLTNGGAYTVALPADASTVTASVYVNGNMVDTGTYIVNTTAVAPTFYSGAAGASKSPSQLAYFEYYATKLSSAQIAQISNNLLLPCSYTTPYSSEYINGILMYDIACTENAISGGDFTGYYKGSAFNKDEAVTLWTSLQLYTGISGVAYIGQRVGSNIKKMRHSNSATVSANLSSVKIQWSYDGLTGWSDIQTQSLPTTASTVTDFDVTAYSAVGTHFIRELANANAPSATAWQVNELRMYTDKKPASTSDIRSVLPANSIALGYIKANSTSVIESDSSSYKYGIRQGATGGNRKVFLGWKYFSGATALKWDNPFGHRKMRLQAVYATDSNGANECDVVIKFFSSIGYGCYVGNFGSYPSNRISVIVEGGGAVYNGVWQTTGYIGCYAEVIE